MSKNIKYCILTNDVETTSIWHNSLRDKTGLKVLNEGMPMLLDLYRELNIKSTFFFTGYIAKLIPDIVRIVIADGHEVGCHGLVHDVDKAFDVLSENDQIKHLIEAKQILENITNKKIISFRAPALRVNNSTVHALTKAGFQIDSSVASQRFDFFMSFGGFNKLKWLCAPRLPYYTSNRTLFKKGDSGIFEVPINSFLIPYIGTTLRIFPYISIILRWLVNIEYKIHNKPLVFLFHPNEIIDESDEPFIRAKNRSKNFFKYILADFFRRKLKIKNLGYAGFKLYKREVMYFKKKNYQFITLQQFKKIYEDKK